MNSWKPRCVCRDGKRRVWESKMKANHRETKDKAKVHYGWKYGSAIARLPNVLLQQDGGHPGEEGDASVEEVNEKLRVWGGR